VLEAVSTGTGGPGAAVRAAEILGEFGRSERAMDLAWSVIDDNDGAYRNFSLIIGFFCFLQCLQHEIFVCHFFSLTIYHKPSTQKF